ncbi:MAG: T9SS type A sorting domain-containing protein [Bradyrhizobiaceae bacterium]|nr:T9SS type A sorting domain-containing protein [Bradyrhizobiaceae bacterium]
MGGIIAVAPCWKAIHLRSQFEKAVERLVLAFAFVGISSVSLTAQDHRWEVFEPMFKPVGFPAVVKLGTSTAIIAGGYSQSNNTSDGVSRSVEMLEVRNGEVVHRMLDSMVHERVEFVLLALDSENVLAIGGVNSSGKAVRSVEQYNLKTGRWTEIGSLIKGRRQHVAFAVNDSQVVVVGGRETSLETLSSAELLNVRTGQSVQIADYPNKINGATSSVFTNGLAFVCGGRAGGPNSSRKPEVYTYDVLNDSWVLIGTMKQGREAAQSIKLENGGTCVVGGSYSEEPPQWTDEVLCEVNGYLKLTNKIPTPTIYCGLAEHVPGIITIVGGWNVDLTVSGKTQFIDVKTGKSWEEADLNFARKYNRAVTLADPSSKQRFTFAIGGLDSNNKPVENIEVMKSCAGGSVSVNQSILRFRGAARSDNGRILLTDTSSYQAGSVWLKSKVFIRNAFDTRFGFRLSSGNDHSQPDGGPAGADGVALVFQNFSETALGETGRGIGYDGIQQAVVVEFDSYSNGAFADPSGSHVAVQVGDGNRTRGSHTDYYMRGIAVQGVPLFIADGTEYHARVKYESGLLSIWVSANKGLADPVLTVPLNIASELGVTTNEPVFIGFTSATGFATQEHELTYWEVGSCDAIVSGVLEEREPGELEPNGTAIYPQPADDVVTIAMGREIENACTARLYDLTGHCVWNSTLPLTSSVMIQTTSFSSGVYSLVLDDGSNIKTYPLIITH